MSALTPTVRWAIRGAVLVALIVYPLVVPQPGFWVVNIGIKSIWLGVAALSLIFLFKSTGLLSLGQLAFWGMAGYTIGYLVQMQEWPYVPAILLALVFGTALGAIVGAFAVRASGVYFLMLTLAIAQLMFFIALQAQQFTRGHQGITGIRPPEILGLDLNNAYVLYFVALATAVALYALTQYLAATPFGLALQGLKDSPERMQALGYNVYAYKVLAFTYAAFIASAAGVLAVFYNRQIVPDGVGLIRTIDVLVAAVLGGVGSFAGAFLGSTVQTMLFNFAQFFTSRHLTLIGVVFVVVVLFFPQGIAGLIAQFRGYGRAIRRRGGPPASSEAPGTAPSGDGSSGGEADTGALTEGARKKATRSD